MKPGEPFNPADLSLVTDGKVYPPAILARQKGTPDNLKLLYWRLYSRFGRNSAAWPGIETLAGELGKSKRQVQYDLEALSTRGLIRVEPRTVGPRKRGNRYRVLWHSMFDEVQPIAPGENDEVQSTVDEVQSNVKNDLTRCNALPRNSSIGLNSPKENAPSENAFSFEGGKPKAKQDPHAFACSVCEDRGVVKGSYPAKVCMCEAGEYVTPPYLHAFYGKSGPPSTWRGAGPDPVLATAREMRWQEMAKAKGTAV